MPKEIRDRSLSLDRSRLSPYPCSSCSRNSLPKNPLEDDNNSKQWEDARCPVCMEHPHNAILLICSSHDKGCRPFMCDTSYRHSNCFDQFKKSSTDTAPDVQITPEDAPNSAPFFQSTTTLSEATVPTLPVPSENLEESKLVCPLCRGQINGWIVVESARRFMNAKSRSCACETCDYNGTYKDLRKHARSVHPFVRPSDVDPERQQSWRRLERQRDLEDLLSTLRSSVGEERSGEGTLTVEEGGWLTVYLLIRFIGPGNTPSRTRLRRSSTGLWGEAYDEETDPGGDENGEHNEPSVRVQSIRRYVRRRRPLNRDNQ